ncbi:hypothetical protein EV182_008497, partial [Spiromyces aspiralis]
PFQFLALDISSDDVLTLSDAFDHLVHRESLDHYTNVNGLQVDAVKQILVEGLPPVLVLHLKRFVFCAEKGVQKLHKYLSYPMLLNIEPRWVSPLKKRALSNAAYRLTTVIYHHGEWAGGGHYTCDVLRQPGEWVRFDDINIEYLPSENH